MKKYAILLAATAFAACTSEPAPEPTPEATETVAAEVEGGLAIDGKPNAGTYEVTSADGKTVMTQAVNADGTMTSLQGAETVTGTWTSTGPGNWCVTYDGEADATCFVETISDDGVYTSTNVADPTDSWTVKRTS